MKHHRVWLDGRRVLAATLLLQVVNRFQPQFAHLQRLPVLHPERLYDLCLGLAGELATFRDPRRPVAYPEYRHDDLASCFRAVMADLRQSLSMVLEQTALPVPNIALCAPSPSVKSNQR